MPNLVGVWNPNLSAEQVKTVVQRQIQRVCTPGQQFDVWRSIFPGFGMAHIDHGLLENGPQPTTAERGRYSLLFDGELYNADELRQRFRGTLSLSSGRTPELCLQLILHEGCQVLRKFNGLFCICLYDSRERRLTLFTDRYGFRPLFVALRSSGLIFGSELKALCIADEEARKIDEVGLLELFVYGSHFHERTWLEGYTRVPPATVLTVDPAGIRQEPYWVYTYQENAPKYDQRSYFTLFATLLDRAVERCMRGTKRKGIFLSGGYDSRSVAASIRPHHRPIPAFTFGHRESRDVRYAAMLADRLGLRHFALTDTGPYLYSHCHGIVWRTEGMIPFANTTSIRFHDRMKQEMDILLTGFLAEFGGSHIWPQLLFARSRRQAIQAIYRRFIQSRVDRVRRVFQSKFFEHTFSAVRDRFDRSFEAVQNEHPFDIADCWNLIYLQPRTTYHAPSIDRHRFEARAPHMDWELVEFLLTIPPYSRIEQRVYKKMIAYRFPEIRDVPCTNSGRPVNPHFASEYLKMTLRYFGRKVSAPVERVLRLHHSVGREFRDLNDDFRAEPQLVDRILRPMLSGGVFPEYIFDLKEIETVIKEHYLQGGRHENLLGLLISWGLACTFFVHGDVSGVPTDAYGA
jgi:asparagine synthase (glutamine-hydrolysing)